MEHKVSINVSLITTNMNGVKSPVKLEITRLGGREPSPWYFPGLCCLAVTRAKRGMRHKGRARHLVARIVRSQGPLCGTSDRPGNSGLKERTLLWLLESS